MIILATAMVFMQEYSFKIKIDSLLTLSSIHAQTTNAEHPRLKTNRGQYKRTISGTLRILVFICMFFFKCLYIERSFSY